MDRLLYSIREFQALTGVGRTRVYEMLKRGEISAVKIGKKTCIPKAEVEAWLTRLPKYPVTDK